MLTSDDYERLVLALLARQPLAEEDRRVLILELVAARRRALDTPPASHDVPTPDPLRRRWAFVAGKQRR
jgi:hypothetical protein